ncbi:hypothetical protein PAEPH01_1571 [Pancytospora epiphaga]|nr:hypothetical protein PAEPH01_1571 [Pancytospora epiphaga]
MYNYPPGVYIQLTLYLLPLLVLSLCYNPAIHYSGYFYLAIISSSLQYYIAEAFISRKLSLVISAVLCIITTLYHKSFFFTYGFVLSQAYNSHLIISDSRQVSRHVFKVHLMGLFVSVCLVIPIYVQVALSIATVVTSLMALPPPIESSDPYTAMKAMFLGTDTGERVTLDVPIDMSLYSNKKIILGNTDENVNFRISSSEYSLLCREFKAYVKGDYEYGRLEIGLFHTLLLLSQGSPLLFFLSLLNPFSIRYIILFIFIAAALCWQVWDQEVAVWLTVFAEFGSSHNIPFKLLSGYIIYLLLVSVRV